MITSVLAERILGAALIDPKSTDILLEVLNENYFDGEYKDIFVAIKKAKTTEKDVTPSTVSKYFTNIIRLLDMTEVITTTVTQRGDCIRYGEERAKEKIQRYLMDLATNATKLDLETLSNKIGSIAIPNFKNGTESEIRDLDINPYMGLKSMGRRYIPTGMPTIDYALNDLGTGLVTLIGGRNNGGKTTFCNQIIANAIDENHKVLIVNGEETQDTIINKIYTAVIGREEEYYDLLKMNKRWKKDPRDTALLALRKWHEGKLKIFSKGESNLKTTDQLFELLKKEVKKTRTDLVVIDNLMSVLTNVNDNEKNGKQADFMQNCCDLAKEYNVHIILVLHPNKTYRKGEDMESEQLSGTGDLANKADNIITVIREYSEEAIRHGINGRIQVVKNREFSDLPKVYVKFEESTGLLLEIDEQHGACRYDFKWKEYLGKVNPWE